MAAWQPSRSRQSSVLLYAVAALIVFSLLPGCSTFSTEPEEVSAELSQAERIAVLKKRLLETHQKLHMQKAELEKLIHNDADLELLLRLMYVKQQAGPVSDGQKDNAQKSQPTEPNEMDYLQRMVANQAAIKSDLAKLIQEINSIPTGTTP